MLQSEEATPEAVNITGLYHRVWRPAVVGECPILLLVHGRTGDAKVMWGFSRTFERFSPLTLSPQALHSDELGGYSWWVVPRAEHAPKHVSLTDLSSACDLLERYVREAARYYGADTSQLHGMGFSQGAALITALSLRSPGLFRSVVSLAGFVPRVALEEYSAPSGIRPRYFFGHGTEDTTITVERARSGVEAIKALGADVEFVTDDVGHKVGPRALQSVTRWYEELIGAAASCSKGSVA